MVKEVKNGWQCFLCGKVHKNELQAVGCEKSHDVVYVPLFREDLFRLLQFIMTKDNTILTERLMKTLRKYKRMDYNK